MHKMAMNMHRCASKQSSMIMRWQTKQKIVVRRRSVYPGLLWALWVLALISGILESKPNGAPGAAPHTEFRLGIKIRMIGEYTGIIIMECDIFFMFYFTIFLVSCYLDTYLATWLVTSTRATSQRAVPRKQVPQVDLLALDARDDAVAP